MSPVKFQSSLKDVPKGWFASATGREDMLDFCDWKDVPKGVNASSTGNEDRLEFCCPDG